MQCHDGNYLDLFEAYVREREGGILLKETGGFAIYKDAGTECGYIQDIYVRPEHRKSGVGRKLLAQAVEIAKNSNKKALLASTDISANNASDSAKAILSTGFKILKLEDTMIWYILEI